MIVFEHVTVPFSQFSIVIQTAQLQGEEELWKTAYFLAENELANSKCFKSLKDE